MDAVKPVIEGIAIKLKKAATGSWRNFDAGVGLCTDWLEDLFHDVTGKVLELHFTDKPLCEDSTAITLVRRNRSWRWGKGHLDGSGCVLAFYSGTSCYLDDYFGREPKTIHGYVTLY